MNSWMIFILGVVAEIGLGSSFRAIAKPQKP